jgi:hypothetical protein
VKRKVKTAATVSSGIAPPPPTVIACSSSPRARSRQLHSEATVPLDTHADAKIAHVRSAKTANLTTCRSCPVMTAALLAG